MAKLKEVSMQFFIVNMSKYKLPINNIKNLIYLFKANVSLYCYIKYNNTVRV